MSYTRKSVMLLLLAVQVMGVNAQKIWENPKYGTDSASRMECAAALSTMNEFVKIDLYDYAFDGWATAYTNCPGASKNIYIYGEKIMDHKIKNAETDEQKQAFIDTLIALYDKRIENFGQKEFVLGKKGIDMIKYMPENIKAGYDVLGQAIELGESKTSESVFVTYMQVSYRLYDAEEISSDQFINDYLKTVEYLENDPRRSSRTDRAIQTIENLFAESGAANCEKLVEIFNPKFEADPDNLDQLKKITSLLADKECQDNQLYANATEKLYTMEPSAEAAYKLARLFKTRNEFEKAKEYYQKAIDNQTDDNKKADYYLELASITLNEFKNKIEARKYARSAIDLNPELGLAYIVIGNAYAGSADECGKDAFEKGAVYWVAIDKYAKAKSIDPSVTERANTLINRYSKYFPGQEEAFFRNLTDGDTYKVECWINETTTVRTIKSSN
ncbi:MAG: hypothetical protein GVY19_04720 [Bacteroidetes bacterium]|jgi:tetratricopeptide (TPR) repeat protein|nr:hypothetical protein [Bacteroidota bacterium]